METKKCKYCQSDIPAKAKICPNCKKKQKRGIGKWIGIIVVVLIIISVISGGSGSDNKDENPQKISSSDSTGESAKSKDDSAKTDTEKETGEEETSAKSEDTNNVFREGDVVETENLRISFLSAGEYVSDNEFLQPKDGYEYWEFAFSFENISDSDQSVSSLVGWECYADNTKADQSYIGDDNGLSATLSAGRTTQGTIYFEVPQDAQSIELEYSINYWNSKKIIFIGK